MPVAVAVLAPDNSAVSVTAALGRTVMVAPDSPSEESEVVMAVVAGGEPVTVNVCSANCT